MNRRNFLTRTFALGAAITAPPPTTSLLRAEETMDLEATGIVVSTNKLTPPSKGWIV